MSEFKDIKVEITKADRRLQSKAGTGAIPEDKIKKAQEKADNNKVDFVPIGSELLSKLAEAIKDAQCNAADNHALMEKLKRPIMRTKASAPMFGYTLAGALAAQLLDFLEAHEAIDDDIIKIVEVHYKTLNYIILNKMGGDCGVHGAAFTKELENARQRYSDKGHNKIGIGQNG